VKSARVTVVNPSGLHARPAALFVRTAGRFRSTIRVRNSGRDDREADAKSVLAIMNLAVGRGTELELTADGDDADEAIETLRQAVEDGLGESLDPTPR
jgi:phosphotransferase system HPr (HPr) family protein